MPGLRRAAAGREAKSLLAMQKVEGSNPFSRSPKSAVLAGLFPFPGRRSSRARGAFSALTDTDLLVAQPFHREVLAELP